MHRVPILPVEADKTSSIDFRKGRYRGVASWLYERMLVRLLFLRIMKRVYSASNVRTSEVGSGTISVKLPERAGGVHSSVGVGSRVCSVGGCYGVNLPMSENKWSGRSQ